VPELSWQPQYDDWLVHPWPVSTWVPGALGMFLPLLSPGGGDEAADFGALSGAVLLQYTGLAGPVAIPAAGVPDLVLTVSPYPQYPIRVDPGMHVKSDQPEQVLAHAFRSTYPDAIAYLLRGHTSSWLYRPEAPEHTEASDATFVGPSWVASRVFLPAHQPAYIAAPEPEQTIPLGARAVYPDYLLPPGRSLDLRTGFARSFQPEQPLEHAFESIYPDWVWRSFLPIASIPLWSASLQPEQVESAAFESIYPDWIDRRTVGIVHYLAFVRSHAADALNHQGWQPWYPDYVWPKQLRAAARPVFGINILPIVGEEAPFLSWQPSYPEFARRTGVQTATHRAWTGSDQPEQTVPGAARAVYPDWLRAGVLPVGSIPSWWSGNSLIPLDHLGWLGVFDAQVWSRTLGSHAMPVLAVRLPAEEVPDLSWQGRYPDRAVRLALLAAWMPSQGWMNIDPIPVIGVGDDTIHLGTKESLGMTPDPTIGGWQPW
jgi:hypothetical protein